MLEELDSREGKGDKRLLLMFIHSLNTLVPFLCVKISKRLNRRSLILIGEKMKLHAFKPIFCSYTMLVDH